MEVKYSILLGGIGHECLRRADFWPQVSERMGMMGKQIDSIQ